MFALVLFVPLPGFAEGCQGEGDTQVNSPPEASADEDSNASGGGHADATGVGETCSNDLDCSRYLRCYEARCEVPPAITGEADASTPKATFVASENGEQSGDLGTFFLELAVEPHEHRQGMMYRREVQPDWGMLFIYSDERDRAFWMKNTLIPLDMIYIDAEGRVVNVIHSAEPLTRNPRPSEGPARFVLELKGGVAEKHGIAAGARMELENVPERFKPTRD